MINDLQTVKEHLKVTPDDLSEDTLITTYMQAAQDEIENFIDYKLSRLTDSPYIPIPAAIKAAQLLIVADLFENRQGAGEKEIKANPAVTRLLFPYRKKMGI